MCFTRSSPSAFPLIYDLSFQQGRYNPSIRDGRLPSERIAP